MPACAFNTVHVRAVAGRSKELGECLQRIAEAVLTTPGCLGYAVRQSQVDPDLWSVHGRWACAEQLHAHFELPALQGFIQLTRECLASHLAFDH